MSDVEREKAALSLARPAPDEGVVAELEALLAKATPGPWKACPSIEWDFFSIYPDTGKSTFPIATEPLLDGKQYLSADYIQNNFALIVATINALPHLLAKAAVSEDVIQADRDAAADFPGGYSYDAQCRIVDDILAGRADNHEAVQAFRRHRLGLTTEREDG